MPGKFLLLLSLVIISLSLNAASDKPGIEGKWVSKGKMETRTLTLNDSGKGQFISEHPQGSCGADLTVQAEGQFAMAAGLAPNCQQKNNAVAFEFYCQQTDINRMRCKIRSTHEKSGSIKEGVEDFDRL